MPGTVIFLNGTSSSGKTTLAHALQEQLPVAYQHMALDQFRDGMPARFRGLNAPAGSTGARGLNVVPVHQPGEAEAWTEVRFGDDGLRVLAGMRRAIRTMVDVGNNVIIDDILLVPAFLDDYLEVFAGTELYFVGVRCPLQVITEREAQRLGRFPGTANSHFVSCHAHAIYDAEVDTSTTAPADCARAVMTRMEAPPRAFDELRENLGSA